MGSSILIFVILAFALGAVVVLKKDEIPPRLKRGLALSAIVMILIAFILILYSMLTLGSTS
ncbi:hypothetical protein [Paenibacillus pini]|uniref:Signal transduction histidine kinase n=1 Tax=Paenibacillus pini JCM 16418 TaxID=1236976 RepID=W7YVQ5_9BACL|nr:hypothetical protein [Paenibacillus pini]GAF06474.1 hypothetical protein JCM16418_430 [Paenibacillus pini JCM 16418]